MIFPMPPHTPQGRLGDYLLKSLISESDTIRRWEAEQVTVSRRVWIDELKDNTGTLRSGFLADVKAMATVQHPLVASVFEAVADEQACFFAHEILPGNSLHSLLRAGTRLEPYRIAHLLRRIAESQLHFEDKRIASHPLSPEAVLVDDSSVVRIANLAFADERNPAESPRDIVRMGTELEGLVAPSRPGTTRVQTLLAWMRGEGLPQPISWSQVREYSSQIEQQLITPTSRPIATKRAKARSRAGLWTILATGTAVAVLFLFLTKGNCAGKRKDPPELPAASPAKGQAVDN
jgi:hypothetical protein